MTKIAILNCYDHIGALFHFNGKNVGERDLLIARVEGFSKTETKIFDVFNNEFPDNGFDAYIISGSDYNPDRDSIAKYEWMKTMLSFIRKTHENKKPLLGICFGHQMIAIALGAKVFELPEPELGFHKIVIEEKWKESPLFKGIEEKFFGIFYHHWAVYKSSLPFGSRILALSPEIPDQVPAFSIDENTYAVQFHPERVSDDVKVMFDKNIEMHTKNTRFNYSESSDANLKVLENFVKGISNKK